MFNKHKGILAIRQTIIELLEAEPATTDQLVAELHALQQATLEQVEHELGLMQEDRTIVYVVNPMPGEYPVWMIYKQIRGGGFMTLDFKPSTTPAAPSQQASLDMSKLGAWRGSRSGQSSGVMGAQNDFLAGLDQAESDFGKKKGGGPAR